MSSSNVGLQLDRHNFEVLRTYAERNGEALDDYVNNSVELGLGLAEIAVEEAPAVVHVGFQDCPTNSYALYPVTYGDADEILAIPEELQAFEAEFAEAATMQPLPLDEELLARVTDMAMLLTVSRRSFVGVSIFFYQEWEKTVRRGGEVVLRDANLDFVTLSFED